MLTVAQAPEQTTALASFAVLVTRERGEVTGSSWIGSRVTTHVKVYTSSAIHRHGRKHMELFVSAVPGWWT